MTYRPVIMVLNLHGISFALHFIRYVFLQRLPTKVIMTDGHLSGKGGLGYRRSELQD